MCMFISTIVQNDTPKAGTDIQKSVGSHAHVSVLNAALLYVIHFFDESESLFIVILEMQVCSMKSDPKCVTGALNSHRP